LPSTPQSRRFFFALLRFRVLSVINFIVILRLAYLLVGAPLLGFPSVRIFGTELKESLNFLLKGGRKVFESNSIILTSRRQQRVHIVIFLADEDPLKAARCQVGGQIGSVAPDHCIVYPEFDGSIGNVLGLALESGKIANKLDAARPRLRLSGYRGLRPSLLLVQDAAPCIGEILIGRPPQKLSLVEKVRDEVAVRFEFRIRFREPLPQLDSEGICAFIDKIDRHIFVVALPMLDFRKFLTNLAELAL